MLVGPFRFSGIKQQRNKLARGKKGHVKVFFPLNRSIFMVVKFTECRIYRQEPLAHSQHSATSTSPPSSSRTFSCPPEGKLVPISGHSPSHSPLATSHPSASVFVDSVLIGAFLGDREVNDQKHDDLVPGSQCLRSRLGRGPSCSRLDVGHPTHFQAPVGQEGLGTPERGGLAATGMV